MRLIKGLILICGIVFLMNCKRESNEKFLEPGVSQELAKLRSSQIRNVNYLLFVNVPELKEEKIDASLVLEFFLADDTNPVILDFLQPQEFLYEVLHKGQIIDYQFKKGHIVFDKGLLELGEVQLEFRFRMGEDALNRQEDYLYTLFVPDKASTAFPSFDQPDIKASFLLNMSVPEHWTAVSNAPVLRTFSDANRKSFAFAKTRLMSTYLFSFVAGDFEQLEMSEDDFKMQLFHRESDTSLLGENLTTIFDQHKQALAQMETYTDIDYPFQKFDIVLIPGFQYSGMEHPGNIYYRDTRLLLPEDASASQKLKRATLIAHETAHMWFGNLVTMRWFNDVWLKEVFANMMAAQIAHPLFSDQNHELLFIIDHYPPAYQIDRTPGANPIQQPLDNLSNAGQLYGPIIYQKAPIVMKNLQQLLGDSLFRIGLQNYLNTYAWGNADWNDLIAILDEQHPKDLEAWSKVWVKSERMPQIQARRDKGTYTFNQSDPLNFDRVWAQSLNLKFFTENNSFTIDYWFDTTAISIAVPQEVKAVLPAAEGLVYGAFIPDSLSMDFLLKRTTGLEEDNQRLANYLTLWENFMQLRIEPLNMMGFLQDAIKTERNPLTYKLLLDYYNFVFWKSISERQKQEIAAQTEPVFWQKLQHQDQIQKVIWNALPGLIYTDESNLKMLQLLRGEKQLPGIEITEQSQMDIAAALAIRAPSSNYQQAIKEVLEQTEQLITNADRKREWEFIKPALSADEAERMAFFEQLLLAENRVVEPYTAKALAYLNHTLRSAEAIKYLKPGLEILPEIQRTGDIFFPSMWLQALMAGHNTTEAADAILSFLDENPDIQPKLKEKVLQNAFPVMQATNWQRKNR